MMVSEMNDTSATAIAMGSGMSSRVRWRALELFAHDDSRVAADAPVELAVADIHRPHARRAVLEQAIGEAAGASRRCRGT